MLLFRCATGEGWNDVMYDLGRPYSIMFQCDQSPSYEKWLANDNVTTGCGHPASFSFFMGFQVIVGMIFLNLFIAILVDSFVGTSECFRLPVK